MDTVDITAAVWVYNQEKKAADLQQQPLAPLKPTEVRIKVLFVAINSRDVSKTHCNHQVGSFGTEVIGKVVMVGENVGSRKVGETVGVICSEFQHRVNGFATFIQVDASRTAFLPVNLPLAESACLLNSGVVAYHALSLNKRAKNIAIIGEGNLAYLTTQFAKKVFKLEVTLYANDQATAQAFGADHFVLRSVA